MQVQQSPRPPGGRNRALLLASTGLVLTLGTAAGLLPLNPPPAASADAPAESFSAERARADVAVLAREPHPIGTDQQREMRRYLVGRLTELGLSPEVQDAVVVADPGETRVRAAAVSNVMARLAGSGDGDADGDEGALLLAAHYDTVPGSPGANDDSAGVAALLETARALMAGPPPGRDVIFLFTDGEETGLYGAKAFAEQHRWSDDVALVLNFEARGLGGPAIMFETGPGTGISLVSGFADASPHPVAASYAYDVYRRLPNDTDFTELARKSGKSGFNFAYIENLSGYHSRRDNLDNLSLDSLQHHGSYALALSRHFGAAQTQGGPAGGLATYFNLPLLGLVVYPSSWSLAISLLGLVMLAAVVVLGHRHGALRLPRLFFALPVLPMAIALAALAAAVVDRLTFAVTGSPRGGLEGPWPYLLAMLLLAAVAAVLVCRLAGRWLRGIELAVAAVAWWAALAVITALTAPSSNYLFAWPLIAAAGLLLYLCRAGEPAPRPHHLGWHLGSLASLLILLLLWSPMVYMVGLAFGARGAIMLATLSGLAAGLIAPLLHPAPPAGRWSLLAATGAALVLAVGIAAGAGYDAERPRPNTLFYVLDTERQEAWWATFDAAPDAWTGQFLEAAEEREFPDLFDRSAFTLLSAPAPELPLPIPEVRVVSEQISGEERRLRLRVDCPRGGYRARLALTAPGGEVRLRSIDGRTVGGVSGEHVEIRYQGVRDEGFIVELVTGTAPLEVTVADRSLGLPGQDEAGWSPRPEDHMARPSTPTDFAEVRVRRSL